MISPCEPSTPTAYSPEKPPVKNAHPLLVEDGQYVEAGTEVVKDIFCQTSGAVEITQKNDILREIVIKPGTLHVVDRPPLTFGEGQIVNAGQEIFPGLVAEELGYAEYIETPEGPALLLRPVVEFAVPDKPPVPSQTARTMLWLLGQTVRGQLGASQKTLLRRQSWP